MTGHCYNYQMLYKLSNAYLIESFKSINYIVDTNAFCNLKDIRFQLNFFLLERIVFRDFISISNVTDKCLKLNFQYESSNTGIQRILFFIRLILTVSNIAYNVSSITYVLHKKLVLLPIEFLC